MTSYFLVDQDAFIGLLLLDTHALKAVLWAIHRMSDVS